MKRTSEEKEADKKDFEIQTRIKSRERYNESSSFFNNFNETSKLPRFAKEGGGT